jgi:gluconolactonase
MATSNSTDEAFHELVPRGARAEVVASGFEFTEGPVWHPDGYLLFSDIPADTRYRWSPEDGASEVLRPSHRCNGMTLDRSGALLVCEHVTSCVVRARLGPDGRELSREVLASTYRGRELNSPNDLVERSDGSIYFSDPTYGRMEGVGLEREPELGFRGVFRLDPCGGLELLVSDFVQPNGLSFSPDESLLYIADSEACSVRRFDVLPSGSLANEQLFASEVGAPIPGEIDFEAPDGLKCDERGNVWTTGPGGIWVIDPTGRHLGTIETPEWSANFTWGGPDLRTLYIACFSSIARIPVSVGPAWTYGLGCSREEP